MGLLTALVLFAGTVCLPVVGTGSLIYCTAFEEEEKMKEQIGYQETWHVDLVSSSQQCTSKIKRGP